MVLLDELPAFGEDCPFAPLLAGVPEDGDGSWPAANAEKNKTAANSTDDIAFILM